MAAEVLTVEHDLTTLDLLLWRRFRREVVGLVEATLAANSGLAALGVYLPIGTKVRVTAPTTPAARAATVVSLYD